ncbi:MAG: T9SS type A sorting domain-containing protein [Bacteroidota bacterium]|nr:T9SS type A sorting domain-containing protein [Bacteroidota bacterium]
MKKYLLFLSFIVPVFVFSQNDSTSLYHPLHIGNEWIYKSSASFFSRKIVGDTLLNGIPYVVIKENYAKTKQISYAYERYDTLSGAFYSLRSSTEDMLDSVSVTAPNKLFNSNLMKFVSAVPETILGTPTVSRIIQMNPVGITREWKFSYGIGLTKELEVDHIWGTGGAITLAYAKINGKEYGNKAILYADSLSQYHPLHNGNVWIYKSTVFHHPNPSSVSYIKKEITTDTLIFENSHGYYYKKISSQTIGSSSVSYDYLRFDAASGNFIRRVNQKDFIDDSTFTSTLFSSFGNLFPNRRIQWIGQDSVLGMLTPVREITIFNSVAENDRGWNYAYGLGLIGEYIAELSPSPIINWKTELVYAKINGVEFGIDPQKQQRDSLLQFYPIHIGDTWIYKIDTTDLHVIETIQKDTTMNNGKRYFLRIKEKKNLVLGELLNLGFFYERIDTNTLQAFNFSNNYEVRTDSLLSNKGDTSSFKTIYADNGIDNIFGKDRAFRTIKFPFPPFETVLKYLHGIGITQRTENAYYDEYPFSLSSSSKYNLLFAKINGVEFGLNPLSVEDEHNSIPTIFSLSQNYPNPFNPATVITYQTPVTNFVTLKVYDILGREVETLVNDIQEAGYYSATFNALKLSSGIYIYQLRSKNFVETKKMMLLR